MMKVAMYSIIFVLVAFSTVHSERDRLAPLYTHSPSERVDGEYIVKIENSCSDDCFDNVIDEFLDKTENDGYDDVLIINRMKTLNMFVARIPRKAVEILQRMDNIKFIEEDSIVTINNEEVREVAAEEVREVDVEVDDFGVE
ncbi:uncharacterized protein LOC144437123 [Glandiceps talaboti]